MNTVYLFSSRLGDFPMLAIDDYKALVEGTGSARAKGVWGEICTVEPDGPESLFEVSPEFKTATVFELIESGFFADERAPLN